MSNSNINPQTGGDQTQTGGKTFTQEDVNRIVGERLAEAKKKAGADLEQKEKDLQRRELSLKAKETLLEKKLPTDLLELVNLNDEASMSKSIELIEKNFQPISSKPDGPQPVDGSGANPVMSEYSDSGIRQAMGLG